MKAVRRFQTSDGVLHDDVKSAEKHANKRYSDALLNLVSNVSELRSLTTPLDFRKKLAEFFDGNIEEFLTLKSLKDDLQLKSDDDDDEYDDDD